MIYRLVVNPNIHFGKPCVAGTRITVQNVLELVREGIPFDVMIRDYYPRLTFDDIEACVQFAIEESEWERVEEARHRRPGQAILGRLMKP